MTSGVNESILVVAAVAAPSIAAFIGAWTAGRMSRKRAGEERDGRDRQRWQERCSPVLAELSVQLDGALLSGQPVDVTCIPKLVEVTQSHPDDWTQEAAGNLVSALKSFSDAERNYLIARARGKDYPILASALVQFERDAAQKLVAELARCLRGAEPQPAPAPKRFEMLRRLRSGWRYRANWRFRRDDPLDIILLSGRNDERFGVNRGADGGHAR